MKTATSTLANRTPDGLLVVDKPTGWTSHDVVARVRRLCGTRRVGHAGTLDPMATGVLVLGIGKATRLLTYIVGAQKTYEATMRLGIGTDTDDADGAITSWRGWPADFPSAALDRAIAMLTGEILQVPPQFSAIKVAGQRSYARARAGQQVALAPRPVTVFDFRVVAQQASEQLVGGEPVLVRDVEVSVVVSSGTYVRALARDLGVALGTGGHLSALRRTRVGGPAPTGFGLDVAVSLDQLTTLGEQDIATGLAIPIVPMAQAVPAFLPTRRVSASEAASLSHGRRITASSQEGVVGAIGPDGALVALIKNDEGGGVGAAPVVVLASGAG